MHYFTVFLEPFLLAYVLGVLFTKYLIPYQEKRQFRQFVREEGPQSHKTKTGTPSMGGVAIIGATVIATAISAFFFDDYLTGILNLAVVLVVMVLFGVIGFIDDYEKAIKKNNDGISPKQKIVLQLAFSIGFAIFAYYKSQIGDAVGTGSCIWIPIFDKSIDLGIFYIPFVVFVMLAFSNAVNLTDGLDGLASGITALVSLCMMLIVATASGISLFASSPDTLTFASEAFAFSGLAGACCGFLVFNRHPARIFMGDTGSMALGGLLASAAIMLKLEFILAIAGLVYVCEALSVIIQVTYYKKTHKRIFRMAPLHHHFELGGMKETSVVKMFWAATLVFCIIATIIYNI